MCGFPIFDIRYRELWSTSSASTDARCRRWSLRLVAELTVGPDRRTLHRMPKTLSQVAQDAAELPAQDRLKLARLMLDLTDPDSDSSDQVQRDWEEEIQKRLQELRTGQVTGVPLEEVKKRIEAGFKS